MAQAPQVSPPDTKAASVLPNRIPPLSYAIGFGLLIIALIEIQFAVPSWHLIYGFLSGRFSGTLSTADQFPTGLVVAAVSIAIWIHRPDYRHTVVPLLVAIGLSSAVTGVLKETFGRARPTWGVRIEEHWENLAKRQKFVDTNPNTILKAQNGDYWLIKTPRIEYWSERRPWFKGDYASFPSGHATSALAFSLWLSLLFPKGRVLWYILGALTCAARIRYRRHHPGDVIFGAGVGYLIGWWVLTNPWFRKVGYRVEAIVNRLTRSG